MQTSSSCQQVCLVPDWVLRDTLSHHYHHEKITQQIKNEQTMQVTSLWEARNIFLAPYNFILKNSSTEFLTHHTQPYCPSPQFRTEFCFIWCPGMYVKAYFIARLTIPTWSDLWHSELYMTNALAKCWPLGIWMFTWFYRIAECIQGHTSQTKYYLRIAFLQAEHKLGVSYPFMEWVWKAELPR